MNLDNLIQVIYEELGGPSDFCISSNNERVINEIKKLQQPTIADYIKDNEADWKKCHRSMVNISELKRIAGED